MATNYTLIFVNNSTMSGDACVYQTEPQMRPGVMSLAWFSKAAHPSTNIEFDWGIDYSFVWSETGILKPGIRFAASQKVDAGLENNNQINFDYVGAAYQFQNLTTGPNAGSLTILQSGNIVPQRTSVGIGMSGAGTFVVQGQPNVTAMFTPHPQYWITFGTFQKGQVLDITNITKKAKIEFPANVYSMTATLDDKNIWHVEPTDAVNQRFLESGKPAEFWGRV